MAAYPGSSQDRQYQQFHLKPGTVIQRNDREINNGIGPYPMPGAKLLIIAVYDEGVEAEFVDDSLCTSAYGTQIDFTDRVNITEEWFMPD